MKMSDRSVTVAYIAGSCDPFPDSFIRQFLYIRSLYEQSPIKTGRHERKLNSVSGKLELLPRCERLCQHCTSNSIEDELHFTLECPLYQKQRKTILVKLYIKFPNLYHLERLDHPNLFIWMMSNDDPVFFICIY